MMITPLMYLSYRLGKQLYVEYQSYYFPGYYIRPATPILDKFKLYVASVVKEVLTDKHVENEGVEFLSKLFMHPETHETAVILLKNVLNDPRFISEGKVFGIDLISGIIRSPQCEEDFKKIVIKTLEDEAVKRETVEIFRYIVSQKEAEDLLSHYFKTVFLRDDLLDGLTKLLTRSAGLTIESE